MGLHVKPTLRAINEFSQSIPFGSTIEKIAKIRSDISDLRKNESGGEKQQGIQQLEDQLLQAYSQLAAEAQQKAAGN